MQDGEWRQGRDRLLEGGPKGDKMRKERVSAVLDHAGFEESILVISMQGRVFKARTRSTSMALATRSPQEKSR
jgi:hypothetical protein